MIQFLIWIIPPVLYFFMVRFFRKQIVFPKIPRIAYFGTIPMFIPILGMIFISVMFILTIVFSVDGTIDYDENSGFYKRWLN